MTQKAQQRPKHTLRMQRFAEFMREHPLGILSSVSPAGDPHGVAIYYTFDNNFHVYFLTRDKTRKCENISRNNRVMLSAVDPKTQTSLQITATCSQITDAHKIKQLLEEIIKISLKTSGTQLTLVNKITVGSLVAIELMPVQMRIATYAKSNSPEVSLFESIESFELVD